MAELMQDGDKVFYRNGRGTVAGKIVDWGNDLIMMQTHVNSFTSCKQINGEWFAYKGYTGWVHRLQRYKRQPR